MLHTIFAGYSSTVGELREKFDFSPIFIADKSAAPLFVLGKFANNKRANENLEFLTGCVLDFDNKESDTEYKDIEHELSGIEHYVYSTFSNSKDSPRWRLVIPYSEAISPTAHIGALNQIIDLIGNPPGLDTTCKVLSQMYIVPGYSAKNKDICFFKHVEGSFFQPEIYDKVDTLQYFQAAASTLGRNQMLGRLCTAMLRDGYFVTEIAEELYRRDRMLNNPSYFEDVREKGNIPGAAEFNAYQFVLSFAKSIKKDCDLKKVFSVRDSSKRFIIAENANNDYAGNYKYITRDFINTIPGVVGEIANDILAQAIFPNPPLALQAALCIVGTCKVHLVRGSSNCRTPIYTVGIAGTGRGKDDPQKYIKDLFAKLQSMKMLAGQPRSFAGLHSALVRSHCKTFCLWDEFGCDLQSITKGSNASWESKTQTELLKLFSSAGSIFQTGELQEKRDKVDTPILHQPGLTIAAFSTPSAFFEAIGSSNIRNGLLPRFLYFTCDRPPRRNYRYKGVYAADHVIERLQPYIEQSLCYQAATDKLKGALLDCGPKEIPPEVMFTDEAFYEYTKIQDREDNKSNSGNIEADIHCRVAEIIERVALILCNDNEITLQDLKIADEIVSSCQHNFLLDIRRNMAESPFAKSANKILRFLEAEGVQSLRNVQRKAGEDSKRLKSLIEYLIHCEYIEMVEVKVGNKVEKRLKIKGNTA